MPTLRHFLNVGFVATSLAVSAGLHLHPRPAWGWNYLLDGTAGTSDGAIGALIDSAGDVISGGFLQDPTPEVVLIKHSGADGSEMWRRSLPGSSDVDGIHFFEDSTGAILAAINRQLPTGPLSSVLLKLSPGGIELWRIDLADVRLSAADLDAAGNLVAIGRIRTSTPDDWDLFVIEVNSSGVELWRRTITGGLMIAAGEEARAVRFDSEGDVIVAGGIVQNPAINLPDFVVFKLSGGSGSEIWRATVPSVAAHGGIALSVSVDPQGNVVAGGGAWD